MKTKQKKQNKPNSDRWLNLVEKTIIKQDDKLFLTLDNLCFLSKNVYNCTIYQFRQAFIHGHRYLSYGEVDKYFRDNDNVDYLALPQKVSQKSVQLASQMFTAFYGSLKSKKKNNSTKKVGLPRYLDSVTGRQTILYTNQAVSTKKLKKEGYYTLSQVTDAEGNLIKFKTNVKNIQFVRISHHGNHIVIDVGYRTYKPFPKATENIAAIDLGVNNVVTLTTNFDSPYIINGKPLKFINHEYNSKIAKIQSANVHCNNIKNNSSICMI